MTVSHFEAVLSLTPARRASARLSTIRKLAKTPEVAPTEMDWPGDPLADMDTQGKYVAFALHETAYLLWLHIYMTTGKGYIFITKSLCATASATILTPLMVICSQKVATNDSTVLRAWRQLELAVYWACPITS